MKKLALVLALVALCLGPRSSLAAPLVPSLRVQGNQLVDADGHPYLLHGAQIEGLNVITPVPQERDAIAHLTTATFTAMRRQWHMNTLRLPLSQWLWVKNPTGYLDRVAQVVYEANAAGLIVVLDAHNSTRNGQPHQAVKLPTPDTLTFWKAVATRFRANPDVIFDAWNEPNTTGIPGHRGSLVASDWDAWLHGGIQAGVQVVGMQDIVDAIRSTGAPQIICVEGLDLGLTFRNMGRDVIRDSNILYEVHAYFGQNAYFGPNASRAAWDTNFGFLSKRFPVYAGEWGLIPSSYFPYNYRYVQRDRAAQTVVDLMNYFDAHKISWTAYAFEVSPEGFLIRDWTTYAPTSFRGHWSYGNRNAAVGMGELVQKHLAGQSDPTAHQ